jgi:hypothetical protein
VALPVAFAAGFLIDGADGGLSSAIAVVLVVGNFAIHGLSLSWAAGISIPVLQMVALGGFVLRMGAIVAALFVLDGTSLFSPVIFGVTVVLATLTLLGYEARLMLGGVGAGLQVPAEPAAAAAAHRLRLREEGR